MMKNVIAGVVKSVSGTAGELLEVRAYHNLESKYGEENAKQLIKDELHNAGESLGTMQTYLRFKHKVQNGDISFIRAEEVAKAEAKLVIQAMVN